MAESIICLGCGGIVDQGGGVPAGEQACSCPPPSIEARTVICSACGGSLKVGARACRFCGSTLASRRCGGCFAWNLSDARHCHACARRLDEEDPGALAAELPCPRCHSPLMARHHAELDVDECDACGGLFVSPRMMDKLVSARDTQTNLRLALPVRPAWKETTVRYLPCPSCKKQMNRRAFGRISGVIVDVCRDHGVWFDAGELTLVLSFIERGGLDRAREREAAEAAEAARSARTDQVRVAMTPTPGHTLTGGLERDLNIVNEIIHMFADLWR